MLQANDVAVIIQIPVAENKEENLSYGSVTKTTSLACSQRRAASAYASDPTAAGGLSALQEAASFASCLPALRLLPQSPGLYPTQREESVTRPERRTTPRPATKG